MARCGAASAGGLLFLLSGAAAQSSPCFYNFGNSSFDLSKFQAQTYYSVQDVSNNLDSKNYSYYFNVCKDVDPYSLPGRPAIGGDATTTAAISCSNTGPGGWAPSAPLSRSGPAPVFQYSTVKVNPTDQCHALGGTIVNNAPKYGLVDPSNPSRGVSIMYTGGDPCPAAYGNRSLKLWVVCDPDVANVPDLERVAESNTCSYEIFVASAYGCPRECPVVPNPSTGLPALCSGHGLCDFDTNLKSSKCFCNNGWSGDDCGSNGSSAGGLSAVGGVLIAVGIFLVVTLAFLGYLWLRIRSLRLDPAAYSSLRSGPDDLSGGADLKGPAVNVN